MSTLETLLAQSPVFSCLSEPRRNLLVESAITRSYQKGNAVAHVGEVWPYLFIITKGGIHAIKSSQEGRNLVVTTFPKGDIFWGLAFFYEGLEMPVTLQAVESTQIALWSWRGDGSVSQKRGHSCLGVEPPDDPENGAGQ